MRFLIDADSIVLVLLFYLQQVYNSTSEQPF